MQPGKRSYNDKENSGCSTNAKSCRWSLGEDVSTNPPLLADMGLTILQDQEDENTSSQPTPTPPCTEVNITVPPQAPKVLQPQNQNIMSHTTFVPEDSVNDEFFVYKRRRLDHIGGDDKLNRMSDELILHIFRWLPKFMLARCAQVCRRWKRLSFDETLWRRLDLGGKTLKPGVVGRVILRGSCVLRLAKAEVAGPIFTPQLQHLPNSLVVRSRLQFLDLSMTAIQPQALEEMLGVCSELRKLSLEHCTMTPAICNLIAQNTHLDTLNLAMCYGLNHTSINAILQGCTRLQSVNLAWTGLTTEDLRMVCRRFPRSLERLNISGCRSTLTDGHVRLIVEQCPGLVELDVSDGTQLTAICVQTIISQLRQVEYLSFSRCYTVQPDAYLDLKSMQNLRYLDVYGILNEKALSTLRQSLPHIQINKYLFSSVARPTVGIRRTSIWGLRVRD